MQESNADGPAKIRDGNQTLARGLRALLAVADTGSGLSVQQVADLLGVHRSIAYRLLQTLVDSGLVSRNRAGAYIPGARLATLSEAYLPTLREIAGPVMRVLADELQSTVMLFVEQGDEAVAISMAEPTTAAHHISFRPGMRTPIDRGSAGYAMLASRRPVADEPQPVSEARRDGYARSSGEIRGGALGVAAWIRTGERHPRACLNLITYSEEIAEAAGPGMRRAADEVSSLLAEVG